MIYHTNMYEKTIPTDGSWLLKISKLCFSYPNRCGTPVLSDFSLELHRGEKIVIEGANGCGKTTLVKCILRALTPQSGTIEKNGQTKIAYLKQDCANSRFPISAREVVAMGLYKSKAKKQSRKTLIDNAMRTMGIYGLAERAFYDLSGGERQKVSIARCLCQEADLLILDEPSSFLDAESKAELTKILNGLLAATAVIVVTHDMELTQNLGWKIITIRDGLR